MPRGEIVGRNRAAKRSYEHRAAPRAGTQCALLAREVLVTAGEAGPAVHRLRFAWPSTYAFLNPKTFNVIAFSSVRTTCQDKMSLPLSTTSHS